mgnify:CR=1 FL=1
MSLGRVGASSGIAPGALRELADVAKVFDDWAAKELPAINEALAERKLEAIMLLDRGAWEKEGEKQ